MSHLSGHNISIVIPAKNEATSLQILLPALIKHYPYAEIIVVDDGSTDESDVVISSYPVTHLKNQYSKGNGAAIKSGIRCAQREWILCMDADGQHRVDDIRLLLEETDDHIDMVVGARTKESQASVARGFANRVYNWFASWVCGQSIPDLTSGFRAFRADIGRQFLALLPNGFSYPTTITMACFRAGYSVTYVPITADKRVGASHIRLLQDGLRFLLIIFKIGTLYSPLKIFFPLSAGVFSLGLSYYFYTLTQFGRLTNMSVLLFLTAVLIFCMGLIAEQITMLMYMQLRNDEELNR